MVRLKRNREKSLRHRHPWVFSGAIEEEPTGIDPGSVVDVVDASGHFIARGYYNENSRIRVRALTWNESEAVDNDWWKGRLHAAIDARSVFNDSADTTAYRIVHAEADRLPGLIVDRYGEVVVVQLLTAGVESARDVILDTLHETLSPVAIWERSDTASRVREGLEASSGVVRGEPAGDTVEILENGHRFTVGLSAGQKTGFYLDQRSSRRHVASFARGRRVLDMFSYTGAFSVYAMCAGAASVTLVDASEPALIAAEQHLAANGVAEGRTELIQADAFELLRAWRDEGKRFDMVVLDPPKFALNRHQVEKALRGYKDINLQAMGLLEPGGLLATFSCSGAVDMADFSLAVSWAGVDLGRDVQILRRFSQGIDHPVLASFPESEYLKGLLCRVV